MSHTIDGVRRLADAGVGAIVLHSLFEEQLREEAELNARLAEAGTESFAESLTYFPSVVEAEPSPRSYLNLVERAVAAVDVPVIASLNCVTPAGWTDYAREMQDAGATAIELNVYYLPGDPSTPGREVEQRYVDVLQRVKDAVTVPVAVKLGPYFSSIGEIALRLDEAGADALVLFNRFLQPHIDPEALAVVPSVALSSPDGALLPQTWIALLRGRVRAALAATTGVDDSADVARYLLAGADVVMTASALLRHGPEHATVLLDGLSAWRHGRDSKRSTSCAACCRCRSKPTRLHTSVSGMSPGCGAPTSAPTVRGEPQNLAREPPPATRGSPSVFHVRSRTAGWTTEAGLLKTALGRLRRWFDARRRCARRWPSVLGSWHRGGRLRAMA